MKWQLAVQKYNVPLKRFCFCFTACRNGEQIQDVFFKMLLYIVL